MDKKAIVRFLSSLEKYNNEKDDLKEASRACHRDKWDFETFSYIKQGLLLWHNKPSMLQEYINQFRDEEENV